MQTNVIEIHCKMKFRKGRIWLESRQRCQQMLLNSKCGSLRFFNLSNYKMNKYNYSINEENSCPSNNSFGWGFKPENTSNSKSPVRGIVSLDRIWISFFQSLLLLLILVIAVALVLVVCMCSCACVRAHMCAHRQVHMSGGSLFLAPIGVSSKYHEKWF